MHLMNYLTQLYLDTSHILVPTYIDMYLDKTESTDVR
jgi:hypothetical protein